MSGADVTTRDVKPLSRNHFHRSICPHHMANEVPTVGARCDGRVAPPRLPIPTVEGLSATSPHLDRCISKYDLFTGRS